MCFSSACKFRGLNVGDISSIHQQALDKELACLFRNARLFHHVFVSYIFQQGPSALARWSENPGHRRVSLHAVPARKLGSLLAAGVREAINMSCW